MGRQRRPHLPLLRWYVSQSAVVVRAPAHCVLHTGTSALKGDFTRTGKRDWRGALNDANNSVARLLLSTSTDFFRQATLDYVLGVNSKAFVEFAERLDSSDPSALLRLAKIREEAVDTAKKEVLQVDEEFIAGWTLLSPTETDVVRSPKAKYEEKVLLLSSKAAYVCSYEFSLQKVRHCLASI